MLQGRQKNTNLTHRQEEVLNIIVREIETNGFPPTVREVRDRLGVSSIRGASVHLEALEKKGYIQKTGKARGIKVLRRSPSLVGNQEIRIPLIGQIQAGLPIWAEENFERYINVKSTYLKGYQKAFALKVEGESMIEAGINPGDTALIFPTQTAQNGDIVVALIEDSVTLKNFHQVDNFIALLPSNSSFDPIIGKEFNIQGKLIGLIKKEDKAYGSLVRRGSLKNEAHLIPMTAKNALDSPKAKWVFGKTIN